MQALGELHAIFQIIEQMTFFSALIMLKELKRKKASKCVLCHEIKFSPWKKSYDRPRQHIKKQRYNFPDKGPYCQSYGFSVVMYGCESWTIKKAEHKRIDAF